MTDHHPEPPDLDEIPPTSEPFADPDPEDVINQEDESDLDPDDRTVDPADPDDD